MQKGKKQKKELKELKPYKGVKNVQPLRTPKAIDDMKWALKKFCSERDYILFLIGINTGLRCGDLLKLTIEDLDGKTELKIQEEKIKKTGKTRTIYLNNIHEEIQAYIVQLKKTKNKNKWLFPSRQGDKAISRAHAYGQLNKAAKMAEVEHIGTHTMRKTALYHLYRKTNNPALIMEIANHSSWAITKRYIGINEEEIKSVFEDFTL